MRLSPTSPPLVAALALIAACSCPPGPAIEAPTTPAPALEEVARVLDGDTIDLAGATPERIRLRGINTPEKGECGAGEARDLLVKLVDGGVVVERSGSGQRGRTLAHLFTRDGVHIQERLVAEGLAHVATYGKPDHLTEPLRLVEDIARANGQGVYGGSLDCPGQLGGAPVRVEAVDPNPEGDDLAPGAGESVLLEGPPGYDMSGWTLKDTSATHRLDLPTGTRLADDGRLRVFTSCGQDGPGVVFWCMKGSAVWNNGGDTAFLLDPGGAVVSWLEYP